MSARVLSMTGYGRGRAALGRRGVNVEIRALNHRGMDIKIRAYDLLLAPEIEGQIVRTIKQYLVRGSVAVSVREDAGDGPGAGLDLDRARHLHAAIEGLRSELGLTAPTDLATVAAFMGGSRPGPGPEIGASEWPALEGAFETALAGLCAMRAREGEAIRVDLESRLSNLRALTERISTLVAGSSSRVAKRLGDRLTALLASGSVTLDAGRLAQEVAILAERFDVSEELVRLRAHFDHLATLLAGEGKDTPGRRIDFLAQEIGRELNTLGGKIQDAAVAALIIDGKAELEKLREQAQNVE